MITMYERPARNCDVARQYVGRTWQHSQVGTVLNRIENESRAHRSEDQRAQRKCHSAEPERKSRLLHQVTRAVH